jgi:hypothetical protein
LKLTDKSFVGAVKAQEVKQRTGQSRKTFIKSTERKLSDILERITDLQNELFPNKVCRNVKLIFQNLFRKWNNLIPSVIDTLKPLEQNFNVITLIKNKGISKNSITFNYNQTKINGKEDLISLCV